MKPTPNDSRFEFPDPTPVEIPVSAERFPNTLAALQAQARAQQALALALIPETFEESDDFDIDDDPIDPATPWELAADAASMTPAQLFEKVYNMTPEQAHAKLAEITRSPAPSPEKQPASPSPGNT